MATERLPRYLRNAGPKQADLDADEQRYRLALFTLNLKLQDQGDKDVWDAWVLVRSRIAPDLIEF